MRKSFTLIELIVVIGIIAVLSALGASSYSGFQKNARDTRRKQDLKTITSALNQYYAANNWIPALVPTYIEALPIDPINNGAPSWTETAVYYSYSYGNVSPDGQQYDLTTRLENTQDPDRCAIKAYRWWYTTTPNYWCTNGATYSPQIYEYSPNSL